MKKCYKIFFELLVVSFIILSAMQSCSMLGNISIYKSNAIIVEKYNTPDIVENETQRRSYTGDLFRTISYISADSIYFEVEKFPNDFDYFFGPPYVPIIPNIFFPLTYIGVGNKRLYHHIVISSRIDTILISSLKFYKNKKEMIPENIELLKYSNNEQIRSYTYNVISINPICIIPNEYYLFAFKFKDRTTKKIEIKYRGKSLFYIKRKMKLYYEPFWFS